MVRFIIGQYKLSRYDRLLIYIPIWLDLLSLPMPVSKFQKEYLHSNMVRFIIIILAFIFRLK